MRRFMIVLLALIAMLAVVVLFLVSSPNALDMFKSRQVFTDPGATNKMIVGYVGNPYKDDYGNSRIPGYVLNNSKQKVTEVKLEIALHNDKGDRKELVKYSVRNVVPGQRKSFDANAGVIEGSRNAKVKILSVEVVK